MSYRGLTPQDVPTIESVIRTLFAPEEAAKFRVEAWREPDRNTWGRKNGPQEYVIYVTDCRQVATGEHRKHPSWSSDMFMGMIQIRKALDRAGYAFPTMHSDRQRVMEINSAKMP